MRTTTKRLVRGITATAVAVGGVALATGSASANSDTYCQHSTCVSGTNYISGASQTATEWICNYQSSANDFVIWITDPWDNNRVLGQETTPSIPSGQCLPSNWYLRVSVPGNDPVQFFARSGSLWSYGTDPVYPS